MSKLTDSISDYNIFITGGAGFLGKHLIEKLYDQNQITIYSRDEAKHYFLKKKYPEIRCIVGDVRNYDLLKRSSRGHDIGIFAASLKQIEACDENYEEANDIIVKGAFNSKRVAQENHFQSACFISSDKSRSPTTIYGAMKLIAGEAFITNNDYSDDYHTKLSTAVYGNIIGSTGSVIPLIQDAIANKYELKLYHEDMTRFLLTVDEAIDLIVKSLSCHGVNVIPVAKSIRIKDLFEIYAERKGLKYKVSKPRPNEKIHELMVSSEEVNRVQYIALDKKYIMYKQPVSHKVIFPNNEYSSRDCTISKEELEKFLLELKFI